MSLAAITRPQSRNEEIANSVSHGLGLVAAIVATPFLIIHAARFGDAAFIVGASIFAATMLMLYLASTLYHALPAGRAKHVFRVIEHSAIFLLIAGTYTPFTLGRVASKRTRTAPSSALTRHAVTFQLLPASFHFSSEMFL